MGNGGYLVDLLFGVLFWGQTCVWEWPPSIAVVLTLFLGGKEKEWRGCWGGSVLMWFVPMRLPTTPGHPGIQARSRSKCSVLERVCVAAFICTLYAVPEIHVLLRWLPRLASLALPTLPIHWTRMLSSHAATASLACALHPRHQL